MKEEDSSTVIDFTDNPKNAALYFDRVIPLNPTVLINGEVEMIREILPDSMVINPVKKELSVSNGALIYCYGNVYNSFVEEQTIKALHSKIYWTSHLFGSINHPYPILHSSNESIFQDTSYNTVSMRLANIQLINTYKAEWKQILEIRRDKKSIDTLRRLKTFFHQNYSGKEKSFIEDDLLNRIGEYNSIVRDWGFETLTSSINMLLTSPVTLTSIGSSLAMGLFGQPLKALATAGTGVGLEIGKVFLHIAEEKNKLSILQRDHPLAYIIDAKEKLEKE